MHRLSITNQVEVKIRGTKRKPKRRIKLRRFVQKRRLRGDVRADRGDFNGKGTTRKGICREQCGQTEGDGHNLLQSERY